MRTISFSVQKSRSDIGKSLRKENRFSGFLKKTLYCFIRFYQICISPLHPPCCRYYPTCSNYAIEAITKYGPFKGVGMAGLRILRCHPFAKGGFDPVP